MDKMREEFEAWIGEYFNGASIERRAHGYNDLLSDALWISWQASRSALCVELPPKYNYDYPEPFNDGFDSAVEEIEETLYKCGVSYK